MKSSSSPDDLCNEVSEAFPAENAKVHHSPVSYLLHSVLYRILIVPHLLLNQALQTFGNLFNRHVPV